MTLPTDFDSASSRLPPGFAPGAPLPSPILGAGAEILSDEGKRRIKELSGPEPRPFLIQLAIVWATIVATILCAVWIRNWAFSLFAIFLVATRQNLLALLVHEQVHYLCSRKRWADIVTNLFAAWPLIALSIEGYAKVHLAHHSYFFTEKDPDFFRKNGPEWTFPMRVRFFCWLFFKDITGGSFIALILGKRSARTDTERRAAPLPRWCRPVYYLLITGLSVCFGCWKILLLYWVLPLVTIFPALVRFGAICEHKYNVHTGRLEDSTAIIVLRPWERLLLPNLNFNYHIYHHYYPGVAFVNLPRVHEIFKAESLVDEKHVFFGYRSYLRHLMAPELAN